LRQEIQTEENTEGNKYFIFLLKLGLLNFALDTDFY